MKLLVDAVIFDLDGTLIDSAEIYSKIVEEACARLRLPAPPRKTILEIARSTKADFRKILPDKIADRKDDLLDQVMHIMREIFPKAFRDNVKLIPGVPGLIQRIHEAGLRIGIVTSTHSRYIDLKISPLKEVGVADLIDSIICIEDSSKRKPNPDPLIKCMAILGVTPDRSAYVGDSYIDIIAGKAAGMKTVGVLTGMDDYKRLEAGGADIIVESVAGLLDYLVLTRE